MHSSILFEINTSLGAPVFQQLVDQVQRLIARGQLKQGVMLPSTREVARELAINPMTVSKAYMQLEREGFILRKKGIGMMVSKSVDPSKVDKRTLLKPLLSELVGQANQLGLSYDETVKYLGEQWGGGQLRGEGND